MKTNKMINFDGEKLAAVIYDSGSNLSQISKEIKAGDTYLSSSIRNGTISRYRLNKICEILRVNPSDYILESDSITKQFEDELPFDAAPSEDFDPARTKEEAFDDLVITIKSALDDFISDYICTRRDRNV